VTPQRLQKILAQAGLGSRRACEELIRQGRVTVNGRTALLGSSADPESEEIRVDGEALPKPEAAVYVALNKPVGVVSSSAAQGDRSTVCDLVDLPTRLYPVGRLDVESEGLILLTNDGETTYRLTHPKHGHEKEYRVLLNRAPDEEQIEAWRRGVILPDGEKALPAAVDLAESTGRKAWVRVVMRQGRKRQIRETARVLGLRVERLIRVRIDGLRLGDLRPGQWRRLSAAEIQRLKSGGPGRAMSAARQGMLDVRPVAIAQRRGRSGKPGRRMDGNG
jgi:23S rRNA pseudouridine2605 synthase